MAVSKYSEVRTEFSTKEGSYKNIKASEFCRPSRQPLFGRELSQVQVSFVSCKDRDGLREWVLFNAGKELYFYPFEGVGKVPDLKRPIDKRVYKAPTLPVCHDFNLLTRSTQRLDLIVGFSTGPLQYLNPLERQAICAFNEDGSIDGTRVTCVKWVPGSENKFVSSHRSGNLYVWSTEHTGKTTGPQNYVLQKEMLDATIHTVKPKNKSPVVSRWSVGHGAINSFAFSPNLIHIAIASQDGFLRVYDFNKLELYGRMRSYFGGFLCVCWTPDGKYAVTGGEDDLVSVWSFEHRRVVSRGEGHKSYVNVVAVDPYTTVLPDPVYTTSSRFSSSEGGVAIQATPSSTGPGSTVDPSSVSSSPYLGRLVSEGGEREAAIAYRLGSVGQDAQLCLWDLSGDALKLRRPFSRTKSRLSRYTSRPQSTGDIPESSAAEEKKRERERWSTISEGVQSNPSPANPSVAQTESKSAVPNHVPAKTKSSPESSHPYTEPQSTPPHMSNLPESAGRTSSNGSSPKKSSSVDNTKESSPSVASEQSSSEKGNGAKDKKLKKEKVPREKHKGERKSAKLVKDPMKKVMKFVGGIAGGGHGYRSREVGTFETCNSDDIAPKMHEVNLMEPLVAKKVSVERLTALVFREDCIVTACQEGFVLTWARPSVVLPAESADHFSSRPTASSNPPGLNSPRPGGGPEAPLKNTTV